MPLACVLGAVVDAAVPSEKLKWQRNGAPESHARLWRSAFGPETSLEGRRGYEQVVAMARDLTRRWATGPANFLFNM